MVLFEAKGQINVELLGSETLQRQAMAVSEPLGTALQQQMAAAKQSLPFDLAVACPEQWAGVGAKRFQAAQLLQKITVDLLQWQQRFWAHHQGMVTARKPIVSQSIERRWALPRWPAVNPPAAG